jgi:serine/threonine-protein kinase RsbW
MFTPLSLFMPMTAKQVLQNTKRTIMMGDDTLWLVADSSSQGMAQIYQFLDVLKYSWSISDALFINIHTAVSEAVLNAAEHGNKWQPNKSVYLCASHYDGAFTFTIEDEGEGFNFLRIENPTDKDKRGQPRGRGVFIMKYLCDHIHYSEEGRCVKMHFSEKKK